MSRFDRGPAGPPPPNPASRLAPIGARCAGPHLEVFKDHAVAGVVPLDNRATHALGRDTDASHIALEHPSCSRRHATLEIEDGKVYLTDEGSAMGTFVDGAGLAPHARTLLADGAALTFGRSTRTYIVRVPGAPPAPAAPLTAEDKRRRLWGGKRDRAGASEAERAREEKNMEGWGAAAGALGGARGDKFLKLMGAKKHKVQKREPGADQSQVLDALQREHDAARSKLFDGRRGLG